jgi:hypothetical protein
VRRIRSRVKAWLDSSTVNLGVHSALVRINEELLERTVAVPV